MWGGLLYSPLRLSIPPVSVSPLGPGVAGACGGPQGSVRFDVIQGEVFSGPGWHHGEGGGRGHMLQDLMSGFSKLLFLLKFTFFVSTDKGSVCLNVFFSF